MRVLVTGGTGFVGSAVARALISEGQQVVCLVRASSPLDNLQGLDVTLAQGDLLDLDALIQAASGCQQVHHVAAYYSTRPEDGQLMQRINVEGTRNLLAAARAVGAERVVVTSTIGTIGRPDEDRLPNEDDLFSDLSSASAYARSKLEAERLALAAAEQGLPVVVVNPCAPVGARDIKPSSTGQRILDYLAGATPSFSPGGINFVAVDDVARGHLLAAQRGRIGQRYILGNRQGNLQRADFYSLMQQVTGVAAPGAQQRSVLARARAMARRLLKPEPAAVPADGAAGFRPSALTADPTRAIVELGLPQTPLEEAFSQAVAWFREQGYLELAHKV